MVRYRQALSADLSLELLLFWEAAEKFRRHIIDQSAQIFDNFISDKAISRIRFLEPSQVASSRDQGSLTAHGEVD